MVAIWSHTYLPKDYYEFLMLRPSLSDIIDSFRSSCCDSESYSEKRAYKCLKCDEDVSNEFFIFIDHEISARIH